MLRRTVSGVMLSLSVLLIVMFSLTVNIKPVKSTWTGTVYIRADGRIDPPDAPIITYDNITYTLIDNITSSGDGIVVERDNVIIDGAGYTIQGTKECPYIGINLIERTNVTIKNANIINFCYGIRLKHSSNNRVSGNNIICTIDGVSLNIDSSYNYISGNNILYNGYAVHFFSRSSYNIIRGNKIIDNYCGVKFEYSSNNWFYHNNFINNNVQVVSYESVNVWDDGYPSGGNYWSDYTSIDEKTGPYQNETGSDGIGDIPYVIDANNVDRYPLMAPFTTFNAGVWNKTEYFVDVASNSTISGFVFNPSKGPYLKFNVTGDDGTVGFCRVTIPKSLLWAEDGWTITINNQQITNYTETKDENNTYLYFTYHHSTQTIVIQGTNVIPEFPPNTVLLGILMLITIPLILAKKNASKKRIANQLSPSFTAYSSVKHTIKSKLNVSFARRIELCWKNPVLNNIFGETVPLYSHKRVKTAILIWLFLGVSNSIT